MSYQPSEIADLVLLLALGPIILASLRHSLPRLPRGAGAIFVAFLGAYVFTIAEGFALNDVFNMLEHICYAVAGIAFVVALLDFRSMTSEPGDGHS